MPSQQANVHKMAINTQLSPRLSNKKPFTAIADIHYRGLEYPTQELFTNLKAFIHSFHTAAAKASHIAVCLISTQRFHPIVAQTTARPQTLAFKRGEDGNVHEERPLSMEEVH